MKILLVILAISASLANASDDSFDKAWEQASQKKETAEENAQRAQDQAMLPAVKSQRVQDALAKASQETGEPASAFRFKCTGACANDVPPMVYFQRIILLSQDKVCRYNALEYGSSASGSSGYVYCLNR
jgi:hypothetical protein